MGSMEQFLQITDRARRSDAEIDNLEALGLPDGAPRLRIAWMYPDVLSLHGGRGDLMALLRFATMARLPVEIRRVSRLADPLELERTDFLYFCCGDLSCMPDLIAALAPCRGELMEFAAAGKLIVANGSSGAILARQLRLQNGTEVEGLGLLDMRWTERNSVYGDDLWMQTAGGVEVIGNEIKLADVTLEEGQAPFAALRYGRGNCGDGYEGAATGSVLYTGCLGPVLVRNPALAMALLHRGAQAAGLWVEPAQFVPDPSDIAMEEQGLAQARVFLTNKMGKGRKQ